MDKEKDDALPRKKADKGAGQQGTARKKKKKKGENDTFYHAFWPIAAFLGRTYAKFTVKFTTRPVRPKEQFLVVCNHLTERDFFIICQLVRGHMYVVVSEHLFRTPIKWQQVAKRLMNPISHAKGATDIGSVGEMMRRVRRGNNLLLFPEGHRSADGVTMPVGKSVGTLIKKMNLCLVTCKITGGYFSEPRWSPTVRKGEVTAGVVGVYPSSEIAQMSAEEIADLVNRDIYEDAYERLLKDPKPYKGENLAEGLDNHLFLCPHCHRISTLGTKGDRIFCDCGLEATYDECAMLKGDLLPFTTVRDWSRWQSETFLQDLDSMEGEITRDAHAELYKINTRTHERIKVDEGELYADKENMHLGDHVFRFADMADTAFMSLGNTLYFQTKAGYFESYGKGVAQIKYQLLWKKATGRR